MGDLENNDKRPNPADKKQEKVPQQLAEATRPETDRVDSADEAGENLTSKRETVDVKDVLEISELQSLLAKHENIESSVQEIKAALQYYGLDGGRRGHVNGLERRKATRILNGIKSLIKDGTIKPEQLAYLGSVDGTRYLLRKVLRQSPKWHEEKAAALKVLIEFISNKRVIFEPSDKKPNAETEKLIFEYISMAQGDMSRAKDLVKEHQEVFLKAQGIFNMALAVQRATGIKARVTESQDLKLNSAKDTIRLELGNVIKGEYRRSGILLKDKNGLTEPFQHDKNYIEKKVIKEPLQPQKTQPEEIEKETWEKRKQFQPSGQTEKGEFSGKKFRGTIILSDGTVVEGKWENEKFAIKNKRLPTWDECKENLDFRANHLGLIINKWPDGKYDYKNLWAQTLNFIHGLESVDKEDLKHIKDNRISIILNSNPPLQSAVKNREVIVNYGDNPSKIAETIKIFVDGHKKRLREVIKGKEGED